MGKSNLEKLRHLSKVTQLADVRIWRQDFGLHTQKALFHDTTAMSALWLPLTACGWNSGSEFYLPLCERLWPPAMPHSAMPHWPAGAAELVLAHHGSYLDTGMHESLGPQAHPPPSPIHPSTCTGCACTEEGTGHLEKAVWREGGIRKTTEDAKGLTWARGGGREES